MDVKTLSEFIEWAAQFDDGQYLFRGVSNDEYKIEASAYRRLPEDEKNNTSKLLKINQVLIEKARSLGHDQKNGQQLSDLELLAELQHFGAATCLIDFTRNAMVALWFACQQSSTGKANGKVCAVRSDDPVRFKTVNAELIKKDIDHFFQLDENNTRYPLYQWQPKLQNNRIVAQQSVFVFGGAQIETEAECVIIESSKEEILNSLDKLLSITEASIFPDFDGFARLHAHNKPHIEPDAQSYLQRGIEAHQNNNLDDAITYYTEVISLDSDHSIIPQAYHNRGNAYYFKGAYDLAIADYNKTIALNPDEAQAYHSRGYTYYVKGAYDLAIADYNKTIALNPDEAQAYYNRGNAYYFKGAYDLAIADYNKTIALNPDEAQAYYNRGNAYYFKGAYDLAIADYNNAIILNPRFAQAYHSRGNAYYVKGAYDLAIADYNNAIILNPRFAQAYHSRGNAYYVKGAYDLAIADYNNAIILNPRFAQAYHSRGNAYYVKGAYDLAIADYNNAIALNPDEAQAYNNRGMCWLHLQNWQETRLDLKVAKNKGMDIIAVFRDNYKNVEEFERRYGVKLPEDIVAMLTPPR